MSFDKNQFRINIIDPVLKSMDLWSESAVNLLLGTCAVESDFGTYLVQKPNGPALGIYQMEPNTYIDIYNNYLSYRIGLKDLIIKSTRTISRPNYYDMITNLWYATAMARVHYLRIPEKLPSHNDIDGLANYWKLYYNTPDGKGATQKFIEKYHQYITPYL